MQSVLWFWLGSIVGSLVGVFTMSLLQASRDSSDE